MRRLKSIKFNGKKSNENSLLCWHRAKNPLVVAYNFILIYLAKYVPSLALKRILYRMTGMKVGRNAAVGLGATMDVFFPELIELGENCIVGFDTTVLAHEFLQRELRIGKVRIGKDSMIGANCTVLPGVEIGEGASVSAMSLVNRDVKKNEFAGGIPVKTLKRRRK